MSYLNQFNKRVVIAVGLSVWALLVGMGLNYVLAIKPTATIVVKLNTGVHLVDTPALTKTAYLPIVFNLYCGMTTDDYLEGAGANNTFSTASALGALPFVYCGTVFSPTVANTSSDVRDFFSVQLDHGNTYSLSLVPLTTTADIDLYLFSSADLSLAHPVKYSAAIGTGQETFTYTVPATGTNPYFILVNAFSTPNVTPYKLLVTKLTP